MKTMLSLLVVILVVGAASVPAYANHDCTGNVTFLAVDTAGNVVVAGPGGLGAVYLCNLDGTATVGGHTTSASACKAMHATLLGAKLSGSAIIIDFFDSLTCATEPGWNGFVQVNWVASS